MDNTQFKNLEESIKHYDMFLYVLKNGVDRYNKDNNQENINAIVKDLVNQHSMNRITLQNLGHDFNENTKIRNLNKKVRELEEELGSDGTVNFRRISQFIDTFSNKIRSDLKEQYGLNCFPKITVGESISVTLEHLSIYIPAKEWDLKYMNSDEEKQEMIDEHQTAYNLAKDKFEVNKEGEIFFNTKNNSFIEEVIKKVFSSHGKISNLEHNLVNFGDKNEGYTINNIKFSLITLSSHLAFIDTFERV